MADQVGFLYGIRQASGYDGLTPRRIEQVAGPIGSGNARLAGFAENVAALHGSEPLAPLSVLFSPMRDLLGIRWIVLGRHAEPPAPGLRLAYDGADARIFENPAALPRAFVARRARCVDDRAALALLRSRAIDPAAEVLLGDCAAPITTSASAQRTEARITVDEPERVVVTAAADAPAWLVLSDTWFPGWRARLDGADVPIARANHAFRAIALPAGRHDVEFVFRPRGLVAGAAISLLSLAVVVALVIRRRRAASLIAAGALVLSAGAAEAALPPSPFELTVAPAKFLSGEDTKVTVRPRGRAEGRWDLYVVWLYTERAVLLGADGAWRPRPTPLRTGVAAGETVTVPWKNAGPAGEATLALLTVDPGGDPLERLDWRFRPSLATVVIGAPSAPRPLPLGTLGALLAASAVVVVVVFRVAPATGPTPPTAAERTPATSRRPLPADSRP